ncbi:MAG: type II secretion system GspH family protein [Planctomycetes bacterium]|nr:type II secretion system GspH family protein [Planctomycetota bacterium]
MTDTGQVIGARHVGGVVVPPRRSRTGFTLIELMIVLGVILLLAAVLIVKGNQWRIESMEKNTMSTIAICEDKILQYHAIFGAYPPDGIDAPVATAEGTPLKSGAALTYALTQPTRKRQLLPSGEWDVTLGDPIHKFPMKDLYVDDGDDEAKELLDAFDNPFHYDCIRTADDYGVQDDDSVHLKSAPRHGDDPREEAGVAVRTTGAQLPGKYDLWSHGKNGHTAEEELRDVLANWVLPEEE